MADFKCKEKDCGFESRGHETKKLADARGKEHMQEHESGEPMRELAEFMKENVK